MKGSNGYILWDEAESRMVTSRTVHRLVRGARYDGEALVKISQGPHDGRVAQESPPVFQDLPPRAATEARPERPARGFDNFKRDAEKFGYTTDGCPKCARAIRYGREGGFRTALALKQAQDKVRGALQGISRRQAPSRGS